MKRTQLTDLLTTIKGTIVSFFAITMFVALGAGLFLGIHWVAGAMHTMANTQFEKGNGHDVEITFPYGLTDEDIEEVEAIDPDDLTVEASWMSFQEVRKGSRKYTLRVGTLPQEIDTFVEVEGTLPQEVDEIALDSTSAWRLGCGVGDTIKLVADGQDGKGMRYLQSQAFTVTALVKSPVYFSSNTKTYGMSTAGSGSIDALGWVVPDAFNQVSFLGGKPYVLVKSARLAGMDSFGDQYVTEVASLEEKINELGDVLSEKRIDGLHELSDTLNSDGASELEIEAQTYMDIEERYEAGAIDDAAYNKELDDLGAQVSVSLAKLGIDAGPLDHNDVEAMAVFLAPYMGAISDGAIEQLREGLASLVDYSWIVLSRSYNGSVVLLEGYADVTANLRWSMASLFLVVGLLVCYSAVSRIVHEQVSRIGTKKALGFRKGEINNLFLLYSALCVVLGMIAGVIVAIVIVEKILLHEMSMLFVFEVPSYVNAFDILLIGALELVLILCATWLAVSGVLNRQAVDLLAGEKPPSAKARFYESWGVWKKMGLLAQTTINNCVNDKRRVVGTLIGVAGCTALIACAVTLNDNVMRSFDRQYNAITHYDAVSSVADSSKAATQGVEELEDAGMDVAEVLQRSLTLRQPDGSLSVATITVPMDNKSFEKVMNVIPVGDYDEDSDGVWVSEGYHEHLKANVGDVVTLVDATGNTCELPIAGFFEWHMLSHQIIVPKQLYEQSFGITAKTNKLLVNTKGSGAKTVAETLKGMNGYGGTNDDKAGNQGAFTEFSKVARIVVLVYLALAAVMAACVLLNLDFMFVNEKKREITVLMINGYSLKEAKGYIWHDSVVLTALGIVLGLILGGVVGSLTVRSIEQANMSFLHGASPMASVVAVIGTVVFAAAALMVALRRIDRFDLTDINRF